MRAGSYGDLIKPRCCRHSGIGALIFLSNRLIVNRSGAGA